MMHDEYGVANWFIRKAIDNEALPVFGDGMILRDYMYVDDVVECFKQVALCAETRGDVFNVGTGRGITFRALAALIVEVAGTGSYKFTEFTQERAEVEPGDYYADVSKIKRVVGWEAQADMRQGLIETIAYYRQHKDFYWNGPSDDGLWPQDS
jgi:UDP-glucose 4-epimerase